MASFTINRTGDTSQYVNFSGSYSVGVSGTTVTISVSASVSKSTASSSHTWGTYNASITVAGSTQSVGDTPFDIPPGGSQGLISKTFTFNNQSPGSHNYGISVSIGGDVMWGNGSATASASIPYPAPSNVSINPSPSRTSINLNRNWSNATTCQYNINNWGWINEGTSYSNGVHVSGNTVSNLTPNTSYTCQIRMYNNGSGPTYSNTSTVTTTGNNPVINSSTQTNLDRTNYQFSYDVTYDTNASYSSIENQWGTTSDYGNYNSTNSIENLSPNTYYYHRFRITDNFGRTSNWYEDTFTTLGNAPVITGVNHQPDRTEDVFMFSYECDENAHFADSETEYGTTLDYGIIPEIPSYLTDLTPNTHYYVKTRMMDDFNRWSDWFASEFTTTGNAPVINNITINKITSKGATYSIDSMTFDTNASFVSTYTQIFFNGTFYKGFTTSNTTISEISLKPGKTYDFRVLVKDNFDRSSDYYRFTIKTKGGFKFNGRMSDSARFNGKEVIGMKFNGIEII